MFFINIFQSFHTYVPSLAHRRQQNNILTATLPHIFPNTPLCNANLKPHHSHSYIYMYKKEIIPYLHMNCSLLSSPPIYIHLCFSPLPRIHTHTCPRVASKDRALMYSTHAYHHLPAGSALCSSHAQDGSRPREIISRRRRHSRLDLLPPPPPPLFYTIYPPLS